MERERRGKGREGGKGKRKGRIAAIIFNKLSLGGKMDLAPQKKILAQPLLPTLTC